MRIEAGAATDVGAVRTRNEDSVLAADGVYVVADGMGGHVAGDVASRIAVDVLGGLSGRGDLTADDVAAAVREANAAILRAGVEHPEQAGMGTTLTGLALVRDGESYAAAVFNVGDSRVYQFAAGRLTQLTTDHNEVAELFAAGRLTAREAAHHPLRNVVTRSLGAGDNAEPDLQLRPLVPGERFLACSDGLPLELAEERIAEVLASVPDPQEAAAELVGRAVAAGGHDNVTALVVDVQQS